VKPAKILVLLSLLIFSLSAYALADDEDSDYAVPAVVDMPMLAFPQANPQMLSSTLKEDINPFPTTEQIKWFDVNRDLQVNDFDLKQFETIVESLHGEKMSGLQLTIRFRVAQKNQRDSFPILYDLDRDGMFTPYDVDYFTQVVNKLDEGASRGNELIQNFKLQLQSRQ